MPFDESGCDFNALFCIFYLIWTFDAMDIILHDTSEAFSLLEGDLLN